MTDNGSSGDYSRNETAREINSPETKRDLDSSLDNSEGREMNPAEANAFPIAGKLQSRISFGWWLGAAVVSLVLWLGIYLVVA